MSFLWSLKNVINELDCISTVKSLYNEIDGVSKIFNCSANFIVVKSTNNGIWWHIKKL